MERKIFIHIPKTGGTAFKGAFGLKGHEDTIIGINKEYEIKFTPGHKTTLENCGGKQAILFFRNPQTRFISAFYCRKFEDKTSRFFPHNQYESEGFKKFPTPNDLAENLFTPEAKLFINHCFHLRCKQIKWVNNFLSLRKNLNKIFFLGFQENLEEDFKTLMGLLSCKKNLPKTPKETNKRTEPVSKDLSSLALTNLKQYYRTDFKLYFYLKTLIRSPHGGYQEL